MMMAKRLQTCDFADMLMYLFKGFTMMAYSMHGQCAAIIDLEADRSSLKLYVVQHAQCNLGGGSGISACGLGVGLEGPSAFPC